MRYDDAADYETFVQRHKDFIYCCHSRTVWWAMAAGDGIIREFQQNIIIGYPSAIKILGEMAEGREVSVNVCRIISCGEPLAPGLKQAKERQFIMMNRIFGVVVFIRMVIS